MTEQRQSHPASERIGFWAAVYRWIYPTQLPQPSEEALDDSEPMSTKEILDEAFYRALPWF